MMAQVWRGSFPEMFSARHQRSLPRREEGAHRLPQQVHWLQRSDGNKKNLKAPIRRGKRQDGSTLCQRYERGNFSFFNKFIILPINNNQYKEKDGATKLDEILEKFQTTFAPPPSFSENYVAIFSENIQRRPFIKVKNLQYKFLD